MAQSWAKDINKALLIGRRRRRRRRRRLNRWTAKPRRRPRGLTDDRRASKKNWTGATSHETSTDCSWEECRIGIPFRPSRALPTRFSRKSLFHRAPERAFVRPSGEMISPSISFSRRSSLFLMTKSGSAAAITLACSLAENLAAVAKTAVPLALPLSLPLVFRDHVSFNFRRFLFPNNPRHLSRTKCNFLPR